MSRVGSNNLYVVPSIAGNLWTWLQSFLVGRTQKVVVGGQHSAQTAVISGVPQGSVLGPLLFLIHLGDIGNNIHSSLLSSFADDTTISKGVNDASGVQHLQQDLNTVFAWAKKNNMVFNEEKFEIMRCGPNRVIKETTKLMTEHGHDISPQPHVKCLGVHLSEDGTFKHHINITVKKAREMAGWVLRTFTSRELEVMLTLWKSLIQPHLDYCSQLWSPHQTGDIQKLEAVQRQFTRQISGMKGLNYWERLQRLGLYSQQRRRDRY